MENLGKCDCFFYTTETLVFSLLVEPVTGVWACVSQASNNIADFDYFTMPLCHCNGAKWNDLPDVGSNRGRQPSARVDSLISSDPSPNPSKHKLLDPPTPPTHPHPSTSPKCGIQFQGVGAQNRKIHWRITVSHKRMILQGVRYPISCVGVCYVNDPHKGRCMASAPTLDLTTSLWGDLAQFPPIPPISPN